ncbi:MAG TPA: mucoidy inhibitor MuiA family protein [Chitinophagales bacterium]|nr:mucoidy inhibitor MuiA family protein [Chitinophagales bacterium]
MRYILLWLLCADACTLLAQEKTLTVSSAIDHVTVFTQDAQVMRTGHAALTAGRNEIQFEKLSPQIDKQSIQVGADKKITILSVSYAVDYFNEPEKQDEIKKLEVTQHDLERQLQAKNSMLDVFNQEENTLQKNQQIGGSNTGLKALDLKAILDFQRDRLIEIKSKQNELSNFIDTLAINLKKVKGQINSIQSKQNKQTGKITVLVESPSAITANFTVSYVVSGANWFPTYDIRVDDISQPMTIEYKANIQQNSGEDWKNIHLTLSNGAPAASAIKPTLETWLLSPYARTEKNTGSTTSGTQVVNMGNYGRVNQVSGRLLDAATNEGIPFATVQVKGTTIGASTDENGNFVLNLPSEYSALTIKYLGYQPQEITNFPSTITIKLNQSSVALEEITVISGGIAAKYGDKLVTRQNSNEYSVDAIKTRGNETVKTNETLHATSISFDIQTPYTILSNGKFFTVEIKRESVPATYIYYAVPKSDLNIYLTAQIINWEDYNLLDGQTNIYLEGTYLGSSLFDLQHAGDTLGLSLGIDKGVAIKRTRLKDFSKRQFIGNSQTEERAFEIAVRNTKPQAIHLIIEDQFPVSSQSDIEVKQIETSGGKVDQTGMISWDLNVASKSESKVILHYSVKFPKSMTLFLE